MYVRWVDNPNPAGAQFTDFHSDLISFVCLQISIDSYFHWTGIRPGTDNLYAERKSVTVTRVIQFDSVVSSELDANSSQN